MTALRLPSLLNGIAAVCMLACSESPNGNTEARGGMAGGPPGLTSVSASTSRTSGSSGGTRALNSTPASGGASQRSTDPKGGVVSSLPATGGGRTSEGITAAGGSQVSARTTATGGQQSSERPSAAGGSPGTRPDATGGTKPGASSSSSSGGSSSSSSGNSNPPTSTPTVTVTGRQLLLNGNPFRIRGVCWNPIPKGKNHPEGLDYPGLAAKDIPLMKAANINAVRTYEPLTNVSVLDQLFAAGIYVLNSVYPYGGAPAGDGAARVNAVKNHPAILMWVIGNEWNYNGLYVDMPASDAQARLNEVARLIRATDPAHPIASVYGELPPKAVVEAMPDIDLWGVNVYSGITFGDRFTKWASTSNKPMFLAEYGADAFNATTGAYDPQSQAEATEALTREITDNCSDTHPNGVALGGTLFEWADEWWKATGSIDEHDNGGVAPGGGPYPDSTFNEEWWGIVDIDRNPRPAYDALKSVYGT